VHRKAGPRIIACDLFWGNFSKKTRMKSKTSHKSNENFALQTQFFFYLLYRQKISKFS